MTVYKPPNARRTRSRIDGTAYPATTLAPLADGDRLQSLIREWAETAVSRATVDEIEDPVGYTATIVDINGPWGFGPSRQEALDDLTSVLIDWVELNLADGDTDIPGMEGVHLTPAG